MTPRLYVPKHRLNADAAIPLDAGQAHYLRNVMRCAIGAPLRVFNGEDGEFEATIAELGKKAGLVMLGAQCRAPVLEPDLELIFAPVKRGPLETIVQKAVELGVARLRPVITDRTVVTRINVDRLQAIAIEAAEQCGRLTVPVIEASIKFPALLGEWPKTRRLIYCDEAGDDATQEWGGAVGRAAPAIAALNDIDSAADKWSVLIGPEGGFTQTERDALRAKDFVTPVTLGPRILRADTAAIAALSLWQAARGDWR